MTETSKKFDSASRARAVPKAEGLAFLKAAKNGDLAAVKEFVEKYGKAGIDVCDRSWSPKGEPLFKTDQQTALWLAAEKGNKPLVRYLIDQGADLELPDRWGYPPLMVAEWPSIAAMLLDAGADIEKKGGEEGITALMFPATRPMLKLLLARGAKIEARDVEGKTALMRVAEGHRARGYATVFGNAKVLLDAGAEIDARDNDGRTPLMLAALRAVYHRSGHDTDDDALDVTMFLIKHGADPELRDKDGCTAAMLARRPRPDLDGDVEHQERVGEYLENEIAQRQEQTRKLFTEGPAQGVGIMKPLQFRR